jgi:hypothetical protein
MKLRKSISSATFALISLSWISVAPARAQLNTSAAAVSTTASNLPADTHSSSLASILKNPPDSKTSAAPDAVANASAPESAESRTRIQRMADDVKAAAARLAHLTKAQRHKWDMAQAALPGFCHKWDQMLHDREVNNLSHLDWHKKDGYETASYTGYGEVQSCEAKESDEGIPIGKVSYEEKNYYLTGKTTEEAKSHPKLIGTTKTLEIFSWEKDRWFY